MSDEEFNPGDIVRRTVNGHGTLNVGDVREVMCVSPGGKSLNVVGDSRTYAASKFALVRKAGRTCQSCSLHSTLGSIDDVSWPCWPCSREASLPNWKPITVTPPTPSMPPSANPLDTQVGGNHYKDYPIQPVEYSMANKLDACQHSVVKYVTRFRDKGSPIKDLEKARHFIDMLIAFENAKPTPATPKV